MAESSPPKLTHATSSLKAGASGVELQVGMRVEHADRGMGTIESIDLDDARKKPCRVKWDNGATEQYSKESAAKFRVLIEGVRLHHPTRGEGTLVKILERDPRNKPYVVEFDNGEVHQYSKDSANKFSLHLASTIAKKARTTGPARRLTGMIHSVRTNQHKNPMVVFQKSCSLAGLQPQLTHCRDIP